MTFSPWLTYLVIALATFTVGFSKGGLAGAFALATPLMIIVMPVEQALGMTLPILMMTDVFAVTAHWKNWDMKLVLLLLPGAVIGVTIGTYLITNSSTRVLQKVLGIIILILSVWKILEPGIKKSLSYENNRKSWHGWLVGTIAGFSSSLAHAGGPPINIFLLMQDLPPAVFLSTSALFFAILNWVKVPYYINSGLLNWQTLVSDLWVIPILPFAVWSEKNYHPN